MSDHDYDENCGCWDCMDRTDMQETAQIRKDHEATLRGVRCPASDGRYSLMDCSLGNHANGYGNTGPCATCGASKEKIRSRLL